MATRTARGILVAALLCYLGVTFLNLLSVKLGPYVLACAVVCLLAVFALQLVHSSPGMTDARMRTKVATLTAQGLLTFLPLIWFGVFWGSMAGFFAGSLLLLLPTKTGWTLYGTAVLAMVVPSTLLDPSVVDLVYIVESTALTGLVVYGLSRLATLVQELHKARADLARLAVSNEQLRFSRDLHDLLGYSLSAVSLKNELVRRLIPTNPLRACEEVDEVLVISRQALADVRRVASGYRQMSLVSELASAESVLAAADVEVSVEAHDGIEHLGQATSTVLATVLREGVTNLLRHSKAANCWITAAIDGEVVRLTIVNDGLVGGPHLPSPHGGSGLGNLQQRVSAIGGRLTRQRLTEADALGEGDGATGVFQLIAEAPVTEARANTDPAQLLGEGASEGQTDKVA
ncbi:sensor histidine kinase [Streptacidiphilus pinicola]|uniref:sensor histidine kinase n=1 Tax=Streptacidiphilus pinicola TaxID=2219663 RepID=UPI0014040352|nr:histidine kinase [Streptacidiphilus pinicola]